jgi:hypothetical protein
MAQTVDVHVVRNNLRHREAEQRSSWESRRIARWSVPRAVPMLGLNEQVNTDEGAS